MPHARITLPSSMLNPVFGKVSYIPIGNDIEVMFTILMAVVGEGWQTGVALDASASMRSTYGKGLTGKPSQQVLDDYVQRGWADIVLKDGVKRMLFKPQAYRDGVQKGYFSKTENVVQTEARQFIHYLAGHLDSDGGTTVIYWACGAGDEIELLGDVRTDDCSTLNVEGPKQVDFGSGTHLLPALKYFDERFHDAPNGLYVFITDGRFDDFEAVKAYCIELARRIQQGERNPMKAVLIGVGVNIDEAQMIELDDLETGTEIDIWDHKIAKDMREVTEIFAELVDESLIVAPQAAIYDESGARVVRFTDGLPAKVVFRMPKTSAYFELEVMGQGRIRQSVQ